jgi:type I restriction enzyme M protein
MSNFQTLSSLIWSVADDVLRGLFKPHEYNGDVIYHNTRNYINGFSKNVYDIIENFQLDKPVEKLHKNNRLFLLVEKFSSVDLHPDVVDNHAMGQDSSARCKVRSAKENNPHFTVRTLHFRLETSEDLQGRGKIRSVFDPCCGTGGMLTIGKDWVLENINPQIEIKIYGQELNPQTYSICKSDLLISGENPDHIRLGSSLGEDGFTGEKFDYMITNPPFGVSWKSEEEFVTAEAQNPNGRFFAGTPRTSDGSLLFLQHMISKMEEKGSRIGIVFNGSPLFTGDAGSGESEIRRWIIENDWLECIVQLPDSLFFNTGITTYIWILNNSKKAQRKGKILLINACGLFKPMKKSLGSKRKEICSEQQQLILDTYTGFSETEICKIYPNTFFGYTKVTIEQPLTDDGAVKTLTKRIRISEKTDTYLDDFKKFSIWIKYVATKTNYLEKSV